MTDRYARVHQIARSAYVADVRSHLHVIPDTLAGLVLAYLLVLLLLPSAVLR